MTCPVCAGARRVASEAQGSAPCPLCRRDCGALDPRQQAREAARSLPEPERYFAPACADAASDVWEPLVRRLVGVVADLYAEIPGAKRAAVAALMDETLNPVVGVWDSERGEWVYRRED